jgi:large subunit ribosomal protein L17
VVKKLFDELAPRYAERPGGYTRVYRLGIRKGDAAEMVILELVDRPGEQKGDGAQRGLLGRLRRGRPAAKPKAAGEK